MLDQLIHRELPNAWSATSALSDQKSGIPSDTAEPVATHEQGAALYVAQVDDQYIASLVQSVYVDDVSADVVTDGVTIDDKQQLAGWINDACESYHNGDSELKAFAIVPHDGTIESIAENSLEDSLGETLPEFADVFGVYINKLPNTVSFDDIDAERASIVNLVYGNIDNPPEIMIELASSAEAAGSATVEVLTITGMDISLNNSDTSQ